ncbi:Pyridoxine/pyridoxamine 5'-phosphate oxidase [Posidoniimonas polymericola]|uniref:Pyridoxine/pyridoxamine 5'-phosphate oxidase n=1 Tax=Posidoniimonas polymericola TaxID=2528002 RepID=A0A5C5YCJ9_9BACT|nr:pyridoxamine 5'-phosphate oxidase [Posidoniimonas polymericola]TWT73426.1 Pyridoxine/pyridoxamine 5'-phosphate oxidase [Posidoniimonas polymericola]
MSVAESLEDFRRHYLRDGLRKADCDPCPTNQLKRWVQEALDASPGEWFEVNAMTLSTASAAGQVSSRVVLLKRLDERGLVFFTNYASEKGRQLAENPRASLAFYWPHLERQVRVAGEVTRVSAEVSDEYFQSRPRGSQLGALASEQSEVVAGREVLEKQLGELEQQYDGQQVPRPTEWGGYLLAPAEFEFWQGRPDRLHDRIRYRRASSDWMIERLSP